jgi:hypothetical protein
VAVEEVAELDVDAGLVLDAVLDVVPVLAQACPTRNGYGSIAPFVSQMQIEFCSIRTKSTYFPRRSRQRLV